MTLSGTTLLETQQKFLFDFQELLQPHRYLENLKKNQEAGTMLPCSTSQYLRTERLKGLLNENPEIQFSVSQKLAFAKSIYFNV